MAELIDLRMRFGELPVLGGVDLVLEEGQILVILGPSGCGKTTLLRIIAGLLEGFTGERRGFEGRRFSFAFQEPRLLAWESVIGNARFALTGATLSQSEVGERVARLVESAGLKGHEKRPVRELSGGMRQRASLLRAFAYPSDMLLMDEAFQSVDLALKRDLMHHFLELLRLEPRTCVLVTHDPAEALLLADRVAVLSARPARVRDSFSLDLPRERRRLGDPALAPYEERLYHAVLAPERQPSS